MLTRYFSPQRKIWLTSLCVGIIVALLAGSIQFMVIYHNRAERFDAIINNVNTYLKSYFTICARPLTACSRWWISPVRILTPGLPPTPRSAPTSALSAGQKRRRLLLLRHGAMNTPSASSSRPSISANPLIWRFCRARR
jgi:hypothetical protein